MARKRFTGSGTHRHGQIIGKMNPGLHRGDPEYWGDKHYRDLPGDGKRIFPISRGGYQLTSTQLTEEIIATGRVDELPPQDRLFVEDVQDKIRAFAEVGRRYPLGSRRQRAWLSELHRLLDAGPA